MIKKRRYTGYDGDAKGRRAGTQKLIDWVLYLNGGKIKNLGSFVLRDMRGKSSRSVHATGRAIDFGFDHYEDGAALADFLVRNNDLLGVEAVIDYWPKPYGRGWRCDRQSWLSYRKPTVAGAPGGKWIHVELSPEFADSSQWYDGAFAHLLRQASGHHPDDVAK
jgi:hypothetical protein